MGHTTRISDYEWDRGDGAKDVAEDTSDEKTVTKSKVVTAKEKKPPVTTTASTKDVKSK